jgi:ribosome-associated protein
VASPSTRPNSKSATIADLAQRAAAIALDNKANDVVVLSLKGVSDMTDFFVIASGTSDTHVRSLGEHIQEGLKRDGTVAHHVEGTQQGRWVLLDYVDFVVHLFHPSLRNFYQLERLWSDAEVVPITAQSARGQ